MQNISVIGSGTMGNGIAHTFAKYGFNVSLIDINNNLLQKAILTISNNLDKQLKNGIITDEQKNAIINNIKTYEDLKTGTVKADLIIEAATENKAIKLNLFK